MPIKRSPHKTLYRARHIDTNEILIRFRAKNYTEAAAVARKQLWISINRDPDFDYDLERYEGGQWRGLSIHKPNPDWEHERMEESLRQHKAKHDELRQFMSDLDERLKGILSRAGEVKANLHAEWLDHLHAAERLGSQQPEKVADVLTYGQARAGEDK